MQGGAVRKKTVENQTQHFRELNNGQRETGKSLLLENQVTYPQSTINRGGRQGGGVGFSKSYSGEAGMALYMGRGTGNGGRKNALEKVQRRRLKMSTF